MVHPECLQATCSADSGVKETGSMVHAGRFSIGNAGDEQVNRRHAFNQHEKMIVKSNPE
jgi:hypothetical protein